VASRKLLVTCDTKLLIPLDELHEIQGELKEMTQDRYDKFRRLVLKRGIWFALHVWKEVTPVHSKSEAKRVASVTKRQAKDASVVKWWIIDGHGRRRMFVKLREDGYAIPDIPCVEIQAASLKEAKEAVLAASSNFQRATSQGLYEFLEGADIDPQALDDYDLPGIDTALFRAEYYDGTVDIDELEEHDPAEKLTFSIACKTMDELNSVQNMFGVTNCKGSYTRLTELVNK
jgi:hypothetical protein